VAVGLLVPLMLVVAAGGLWWRLSAGPLVLPQSVVARVQAQIDGAMALNAVQLGAVAVMLPDGWVPEVEMRDITMIDPDGAVRAAFPALRVRLSSAALLRGALRPTRVEIAGAGVQLRRDEAGRIDLQLTQAQSAAALSLPETLARVDAMFADPIFTDLQDVVGSDLNLAMADAMTGQVMRLRDARMRLVRGPGAMTLTIGAGLEGSREAGLDLAITRLAQAGRTEMAMGFSNLAARDVATVAPALAWLDLMRAPISGRVAARLNDDGSVGDMTGRLDIGAGQFSVEGVSAPLRFETMVADFTFDATTRRMTFSELALAAPELSFRAEGHADVSGDGSVFVGQFRLADIIADPRGLYPSPLQIDGAAIDLRLALAPDLRVEIGQAVLFDDDLRVHGSARVAADAAGLTLAVDASVEQATTAQVLGYWPEAAIDRVRIWVVENLDHAVLQGADVAVRMAPGAPVRSDVQFDFEDGQLRAIPALPPITDAAGYLSLSGNRLVMRLDAGRIAAPGGGPVALNGSSFVIGDTSVRGPDAVIDLRVAGPMTDILRLLAEPPVAMFDQGSMTPEDLGQAQADLTARIETRLLQHVDLADVDFAVDGVIRDYRVEALVPGQVLAADQLRVTVSPDAVTVQGQATLDGLRITGQWGRALGPDAPPGSRVEARARLDRATLAQFGVVLPDWMLSGATEADLDLALAPDAAPVLTLRSDLQGLGLAVPPLGWAMGQGQSGDLRMVVQLGPDPAVPQFDLSGAGLTLTGRIALAPGGGFDRLSADRFRIGTWIDVTGALVGTGVGRPPRIEVAGGIVDLRGAPPGRGGAGVGDGGPVIVRLDRLQVTEGIALQDLQADLSGAGGLSGQFVGRVNGQAPVTGTLIATENGPAVRVRAGDAGAVLRAAGLLQTIYGGEMELIIGATGTAGVYDGQLDIAGPRLRDAPAMAELLNLISVVGLLEQLGGEGINLGDVDARFQIRPSQIVVSRGSAVGPSMGISLDGVYDISARQLDMQGVLSPLYMVNGMIGALFAPRREGLFGFSFRLTGPPDNTDVAVNPLSILTPGIFREIFRRPPPDLVEAE
jgi:hypothetical protein